MAKISIESNNVQIQLSPLDRFWSIHGSLEIPLAHITSARVEDEDGWSHVWRKVIGTNAPGLKMAGTFFMEGGLAFLDYGDGKNCVVIQTQHERYQTVIVQLDRGTDPDAIVAEINRRVGHV
ncbi:MAG TPA: hypothetical protein VGZ02_08765 [Candidatus Baltobacteraceae bacterium]|jgi:hypothetical protein|nr:hypothetical protein [Candidatus Baltobacteraceae bacterium]